jgi:hypothetical protein
MKFVVGALLGFAAGLAGAILLAPEKRRGASGFPEGHPARSINGHEESGLRGALRSLQDHVNEAWEEARVAAEKAEQEMMTRYKETIGEVEEEAKRATEQPAKEAVPAGKKK